MENELILEIGTEEIPASFITPALTQLETILSEKLTSLSLTFSSLKTGGTPRRLSVIMSGLIAVQPDRREEIMGPPKKAAFDADNLPTQAAMGFAKSKGARLEDITIVDTPKGEYLKLVINKIGVATSELLGEVLWGVITSIRFPKSMRWGSGRIPFARPIQSIIALYGGRVVPLTVNEVESGNICRGHRFMAPDPFEVEDSDQYDRELRARHVLLDPMERKEAVMNAARKAAEEVGGRLLDDPELAETVANLVESPFPICGSFEKRFLAIPKDVLITSMREHQKYFAVTDADDTLLPYFIAVNNTRVHDHRMAAEGHQRVLRARLEDAFFFFSEDKKKSLAARTASLEGIVFQTKLGNMREKTERITVLAGKLAERLSPTQKTTCDRAAFLCKADLLTNMVNEFPSLQGAMGREYALLDNEPREVAQAIHEHYLPIRAGSALPKSIAGALVSMADRLDTITGCFGIGQLPSGTADPFGLRRLALGLIHVINDKGFHFLLRDVVKEAIALYGEKLTAPATTTEEGVLAFIQGRFHNDLTGRGVASETVEAVVSVVFEDINDCRLRIEALAAMQEEPSFRLLAGSFKRVMNIIKEQNANQVEEALLQEPAEKHLHEALKKVDGALRPLLEERKYREAMEIILTMKEPIDTFFNNVMVMTDDMAVRGNRIALLADIARVFLSIGDFSKMYSIV